MNRWQKKSWGLSRIPSTGIFSGRTARRKSASAHLQPNGQYITERIDRLVIRASDILVLDYKTDWHVPDRLDAGHPHVMQLARYVRTLGQAYDGRPVRAAILWTSLPRLGLDCGRYAAGSHFQHGSHHVNECRP